MPPVPSLATPLLAFLSVSLVTSIASSHVCSSAAYLLITLASESVCTVHTPGEWLLPVASLALLISLNMSSLWEECLIDFVISWIVSKAFLIGFHCITGSKIDWITCHSNAHKLPLACLLGSSYNTWHSSTHGTCPIIVLSLSAWTEADSFCI